ncbi:MAG TPA: hypothetical protein VJU60_02510 [Thermoleophilaceae bacterium]|nr:hypothetical protein [Thermoleophilaceae bacterium]
MPSHQTIRLSAGRHKSASAGACVMELASMLAHEPFSDRPGTASPVIAAFLRTYNDGLDDDLRQELYPLASLIVGSAGSRGLEEARASRCLAFAESLGHHLPRGRAAMGMATPEASGTWAAHAALRTGPAPEVHAQALTFARELALMRERHRRRLPAWLVGRDPAEVIAEATEVREQVTPLP